jgi:hypothetical protein
MWHSLRVSDTQRLSCNLGLILRTFQIAFDSTLLITGLVTLNESVLCWVSRNGLHLELDLGRGQKLLFEVRPCRPQQFVTLLIANTKQIITAYNCLKLMELQSQYQPPQSANEDLERCNSHSLLFVLFCDVCTQISSIYFIYLYFLWQRQRVCVCGYKGHAGSGLVL